ncbi:Angiomotin-like protein [Trichinella spiralis]|uniref:Angiomotin-like protein n=1 Tax=Trichinella spiralis TaxID=6334 RepID=A0ABR3KK53_TRISP
MLQLQTKNNLQKMMDNLKPSHQLPSPSPSTNDIPYLPPSKYGYTSYPRPRPEIEYQPAPQIHNTPQLNFPTNSVSQLFSITQDCYPNCGSQQLFLIPPPPSIPPQPIPCGGTLDNCKQRRFKRFIFHV